MTTPAEHLDASMIAARLETWFAGAKRELPWRKKGRSKRDRGYRTLVAEAMLQQTQVSRVVERFGPFMKQFPNIEALAQAKEQEILALWQGLGYYRRARHLHAAAKMVVEEFNGVVPDSIDDLLRLPGVGRYTAGAIASIAYQHPEPIVDGNVTRVVARLLALEAPTESREAQRMIWDEATRFVERASHPADFNQAFMELGSTVCLPRGARCEACPITDACRAKARNRVDQIPAPKKPANQREIYAASIVVRKGDRLLLVQRPAQGI